MKTIEYRTIDKKSWPRGPWDDEPDKKQWQDPESGLPCLIVRQPQSGHLCGYVGVKPGHRMFGQDWNHEEEIDVHGGITFGNKCQEEAEETSVCHVVENAEEDGVWWLGFDCCHGGDLSHIVPISGLRMSLYGEYRNFDYVTAECTSLAKQLAAMEK